MSFRTTGVSRMISSTGIRPPDLRLARRWLMTAARLVESCVSKQFPLVRWEHRNQSLYC